MQALRDNDEEKFIGAYVKEPIVGKYDWIYDLDLTSLYPSIIMTLNISPETKIGKIQNWDAERWIKGEDVGTYTIVGKDDTYEYTKEELAEVIRDSNLGVAANGVLYNQDKPGFIKDLSKILADNKINIATFHLGRLSSGGEAIAIISTDNKIENSVIESIKKIPLVIQAKYIQFKDKENE